jgi:hypothetical protein
MQSKDNTEKSRGFMALVNIPYEELSTEKIYH